MINVNNLLRRSRSVVIFAFFAILMLSTGAVNAPVSENAIAQEECRTRSTLPIGDILSARGRKQGRVVEIQFTLKSPHTMFCDFGSCCFGNRDKIAFKPGSSQNVESAVSDGGCNFNWVVTGANHTDDIVAAFKVLYNENAALPNCNPKRNPFFFNIGQFANGSASVYSGDFDIELFDGPDDND